MSVSQKGIQRKLPLNSQNSFFAQHEQNNNYFLGMQDLQQQPNNNMHFNPNHAIASSRTPPIQSHRQLITSPNQNRALKSARSPSNSLLSVSQFNLPQTPHSPTIFSQPQPSQFYSQQQFQQSNYNGYQPQQLQDQNGIMQQDLGDVPQEQTQNSAQIMYQYPVIPIQPPQQPYSFIQQPPSSQIQFQLPQNFQSLGIQQIQQDALSQIRASSSKRGEINSTHSDTSRRSPKQWRAKWVKQPGREPQQTWESLESEDIRQGGGMEYNSKDNQTYNPLDTKRTSFSKTSPQKLSKVLRVVAYLDKKRLQQEGCEILCEFCEGVFSKINEISPNSEDQQPLIFFSQIQSERNELFAWASKFQCYLLTGVFGQPISHNSRHFQSQTPFCASISQFTLPGAFPHLSTKNLQQLDVLSQTMHFLLVNNSSSYTEDLKTHTKQQNQVLQKQQQFEEDHQNNNEQSELSSFLSSATTLHELPSKLLQISYLNNEAVLNMCIQNYSLACQQFEQIYQYLTSSLAINRQNSTLMNNCSLFYIILNKISQAEQILQSAISSQQKQLIPTMRDIDIRYLRGDEQFLGELAQLLFSYSLLDIVNKIKEYNNKGNNNNIQNNNKQNENTNNESNIAQGIVYAKRFYGVDNQICTKLINVQEILKNSSITLFKSTYEISAGLQSVLNEYGISLNQRGINQVIRYFSFQLEFNESQMYATQYNSNKDENQNNNQVLNVRKLSNQQFKISNSNYNNKIYQQESPSNQIPQNKRNLHLDSDTMEESNIKQVGGSTRTSTEPSSMFKKGSIPSTNQFSIEQALQNERGPSEIHSNNNPSEPQSNNPYLFNIKKNSYPPEITNIIATVPSSNNQQKQEVSNAQPSILKQNSFKKIVQIKSMSFKQNNINPEIQRQGSFFSKEDKIAPRRVTSEYEFKGMLSNKNIPPSQSQNLNVIQYILYLQQHFLLIQIKEESIKNAVAEAIQQSQKMKVDKESQNAEISELKKMVSGLLDEQKNLYEQLKIQQNKFLEDQQNQMKILDNQSRKRQEQALLAPNSNKNKSSKFQFRNQQPSANAGNSKEFLQQSEIEKLLELVTENSFGLSKQIQIGGNLDKILITCSLNKRELIIKAESNTKTIAQENIEINQVKALLSNLQYQSLLPPTFNLNMTQTIQYLLKFFILPFATLDPALKEIKFLSQAPGLLSKVYERDFMGENMNEFFHHIEGNMFRIILQQPNRGSGSSSIKIDLELDSGSQKKWLDSWDENEYARNEISTMLEITKESVQQRLDMKEMMQRQVDFNKLSEISSQYNKNSRNNNRVRNFKALNESFLIKELNSIIDGISEVLTSLMTVTEITQRLIYIRVRVWSLVLKRQVQISYDDTNSSEIKVILYNLHQTFGPGGDKIKAKGFATVCYPFIKQFYGLEYESLSASNKLSIISQMSELYQLNVHEKNDSSLQNKNSKQETNPIAKTQYQTAAFTRLLHSFTINGISRSEQQKQYVHPVTIEIVGANQRLLGIRVLIFNTDTCEQNGIFFTADEQHWAFENKILLKNSHHLYLDSLPLSQLFLPHILEDVLTPIILKHISVDQSKGSGEIEIKLNKGLLTPLNSPIYRIENILSVQAIIDHFLSNGSNISP